MKRKERGVTLIILVIMIIIIMIIASVSIYSSTGRIQETKEDRLTLELEMVQHAVLEIYTKYLLIPNEDYLLGTEIASINELPDEYTDLILSPVAGFLSTAIKEEKYFKLSEEDLYDIGITDSKYEYIVNYKNGEVMNADVYKTASGKVLYISKDFNEL